jgi:hypothetical protein
MRASVSSTPRADDARVPPELRTGLRERRQLSCFEPMSCDDDEPVGQTGSEAALKPENVATMA